MQNENENDSHGRKKTHDNVGYWQKLIKLALVTCCYRLQTFMCTLLSPIGQSTSRSTLEETSGCSTFTVLGYREIQDQSLQYNQRRCPSLNLRLPSLFIRYDGAKSTVDMILGRSSGVVQLQPTSHLCSVGRKQLNTNHESGSANDSLHEVNKGEGDSLHK